MLNPRNRQVRKSWLTMPKLSKESDRIVMLRFYFILAVFAALVILKIVNPRWWQEFNRCSLRDQQMLQGQ